MRGFFFSAGVLLWMCGAALQGDELVRDETRLFTDEQRSALTGKLHALRDRTGVEFCVVALTYGGGVSVRETAAELANSRGEDRAAVVLLHNRGRGESGIAVSRAFWQRYPADEVVVLLDEGVRHLQYAELPPDRRVLGAVDKVLERVPRMESRLAQRSRPMTRQDLLLGAGMAGGLVVLLAAGWLVAWWTRAKAARNAGLHFPEVEVGMRLGAPYGGGVVAETRADQ